MGKNLPEKDSGGLSLNNNNSNNRTKCMWGIFHHLNHYRWNAVKKRLPYRRRTASKHGAAVGDPESKPSPSPTAELQEQADTKMGSSPIEVKSRESVSVSKSMKSRLKAWIPEKRGKVRHRRSSSCPTQPIPIKQTVPIVHPDQSLHVNDPLPQTYLTGKTLEHHNNVHTSLASLLDPPLPKICNGEVTPNHTCDLCVAMLKMNYLKQSEIGMHGMQGFEDHTLLQNRLIYAIEPTKTASLQESKLFLKALDLLNMRKEVFLKILQDPNSSLVHQLHDRRSSKIRLGLGKSKSFPSPGSLLKGGNGGLIQGDHARKHFCTNPELLDNAIRHSPSEEKSRKHGGLKRFKNLRDKLKYVIKESRKEGHRIVMDAFLDKIPRGRRIPKDVKEGSPHFNSPPFRKMKRASSYHESAERYSQLFECCFHREESHRHIPDKRGHRSSEAPTPATRSPRALQRILSLPDLRCYSSFRSEDSQFDTFSVKTSTGNNLNAGGSSKHGERKVMYTPTCSEYHTLSEVNSDENLQDGFQDVGDTFDETSGLRTEESSAPNDNTVESTTCPDTALDSEPPAMNTTEEESQQNESKTETSSVAESEVDAEREGSPVSGLNNILMHLHVDDKNKAQFDYVKDVLELSGFSGIEFLESWNSAELPLNPSVFDEVEGCLVAHPDCTGNEEGGSCNHLLLFDLINDVLLEMYEKSFSYWPKLLTCHSCIHRMPVGYRVLEEVWAKVNWLLSWTHDLHQTLDDAVCRDFAKGNNWMNLQFDAECVGLELEELVLEDLLDELIYDDLLF